ncbi:MAG: hypothetical protein HY831_02780 [Candidatus Aenigmarchaeota archaeon]|nr:hypothetical protein [Candidatus Aenigmarchaeota archaeon]
MEDMVEFVVGLIIILLVIVVIIFLMLTPFGAQIASSMDKIVSMMSKLFAPVTTS